MCSLAVGHYVVPHYGPIISLAGSGAGLVVAAEICVVIIDRHDEPRHGDAGEWLIRADNGRLAKRAFSFQIGGSP